MFVGEIVALALEFDSGDEAKEDPYYVVRYTDGDQEDFDGKELSRGLELLYHKTTQKEGGTVVSIEGSSSDEADDGDETMSSGSADEESYVPSPEVHIGHFHSRELYVLQHNLAPN